MKWIPVSERLPDLGEWCDVWSLGERITDCQFGHPKENKFTKHEYGIGDTEVDDVTHWMPLPEPPFRR